MATKAITKRNWTIMVYLAGDNNLDSAGVVDLKEMKTVGTTDQIAVLAQFDRAGAKAATVRYCLQEGDNGRQGRGADARGNQHGGPEGAGGFCHLGGHELSGRPLPAGALEPWRRLG